MTSAYFGIQVFGVSRDFSTRSVTRTALDDCRMVATNAVKSSALQRDGAALNLLVQKGLGNQRATALNLGVQAYAMSCPRSKDPGAKITGALMPGDHTFKSRDQMGWRARLDLDNQTRKAR